MMKLSPLSQTVHTLDANNCPSTIHIVLEINGKPFTQKELYKLCQDRLLCYPTFRSRIDNDALNWIESPHPDLANHVYIQPLETHIDTYLGSILNKSFKSHCSPWELHFLETSNYTTCNYLVLRVSHAIGDGQILKSILEGLADRIQNSKKPQPLAYNNPKNTTCNTTSLYLIVTFVVALIGYIITAYHTPTRFVVIICMIFAVLIIGYNAYAILTKSISLISVKNKHVSDVKSFSRTKALDLTYLKKWKNKLPNKYTLNDVIISIIAGGIVRYHALPCHNKTRSMPKNIYISALHALGRQKQSTEELRELYKLFADENKFGFIVLPLTLDNDINAYDRLEKVATNIRSLSSKILMHIINYISILLCSCRLINIVPYLVRYALTNILETYISNVNTGIDCAETIYGRTVDTIYHCTAPLSLGCTFSILSYNNKLVISSSADSNIIPDLKKLISCIELEYDTLLGAGEL